MIAAAATAAKTPNNFRGEIVLSVNHVVENIQNHYSLLQKDKKFSKRCWLSRKQMLDLTVWQKFLLEPRC
jgi:hypothetical protein